jgi:hypothetical protein
MDKQNESSDTHEIGKKAKKYQRNSHNMMQKHLEKIFAFHIVKLWHQ